MYLNSLLVIDTTLRMSLSGKLSLCIGATKGIGKAIALKLAVLQSDVIVSGRSQIEGNQVVEELKKIHPTGRHSFIQCDASLLSNIKETCDSIKKDYISINYMVCSQGIMSLNGRTETREGIDVKLAVHYYGRILFIQELLPLLRNSANQGVDTRVISVLSGGVHSSYTSMDDIELKNNFTIVNAANAAGFYNDLSLEQLSIDEDICTTYNNSKEYKKISFIHCAPGFVSTTWGHESLLKYAIQFIQLFAMTPQQCAESLVMNGVMGEHMSNGYHIMSPDGKEAKKTKEHNEFYRNTVWTHTIDTFNRIVGNK